MEILRNHTIAWVLVIWCAAIQLAIAEDSAVQEIRIKCSYHDSFDIANFSTALTSLQETAVDIGPQLCRSVFYLSEEEKKELPQKLQDIAHNTKTRANNYFPESLFPGTKALFDTWEQQIQLAYSDSDFMSVLEFTTSKPDIGIVDLQMKLTPNPANLLQFRLDTAQKEHCKSFEGIDTCEQLSDSFENALKPLFMPIREIYINNELDKIAPLQQQWKDFIDDSRYQTPLDVWFTTQLQKDKFHSLDLVGPPQLQWFLLHPSLVYENVNDAEKGNKDDISLALEWVGVNWWRKGFGFSITSVYKDRAEIDSVGHGITLHINNKYSLGYVYRSDGNESVFFNIDFLEWFGDKKQKYEKYKGKY